MNREPQPHPRLDRAVGMVLAAAVGDALGWPYERRDRTRRLPADSGTNQFVAWERTAGSRFRPFTEVIGAGDYSDDTQMIIAVGRALLTAGDEWLTWLQRVEWPLLPFYERGAGASVKRACKAWTQERPPWTVGASDVRKYFDTGANGAAMRIAPHVIHHHADSRFDDLAVDVVRNAATTHGHPRALLGALVHAQALWLSMRQPTPLSYGWLIEALLDSTAQWQKPIFQALGEEWQNRASHALEQPLDRLWLATSREVEDLLTLAHKELKSGAVSAPTVFLKSQGLTGKARGSGTLCAVAAAYLAARSAASPDHALTAAARLEGADTDTLASMTASLLGAALGQEWLGANGRNVQDRPLLVALAQDLLAPAIPPRLQPPSPEQARTALAEFTDQLAHAVPGSILPVPYQRTAHVEARQDTRAGQWAARQVQLLTDDGQRLHLLHSVHRATPPQTKQPDPPGTQLQGAYLAVTDIQRVRQVLDEIFGLRPDRYGQTWVAYGNLVIAEDTSSSHALASPPRAQLRLTSEHPQQIWQLVQEYDLPGSADDAHTHFLVHVDPWLTITLNRPGNRPAGRP
ncbi:ADP-ribosylglycohydrolase family protein [Streptomyces sp. NBC_00258]|uniref:ADP-ribosylglycohydrolase family protein n=1 Tax=Streptomyces sp. NBC_00258 TaxID=2903642 RepID=UPI002E293C12|nr:ADP-ribosylglycohydrolase family protein [Streptomyces sp. NBC_00258]